MTASLLWFAGGVFVGAIAGTVGTVRIFLAMHHNSLPPKG